MRYYLNNFVDGTKQVGSIFIFSLKKYFVKLTTFSIDFKCTLAFVKDAIDLLQGHYIVSVSRDLTPTAQKGGLEAVAVSDIENGSAHSKGVIKQPT